MRASFSQSIAAHSRTSGSYVLVSLCKISPSDHARVKKIEELRVSVAFFVSLPLFGIWKSLTVAPSFRSIMTA